MKLPIRRLDLGKPAEKAAHDEIVALVETMLALQKERAALRPEDSYDEVRSLERKINEVDAAIDRKVYALHGLTEQEIRMVEGRED